MIKKYKKGTVNVDERDAHKPTISEKTARLAENARKKLVGDKKNVTLVEILLHPKNTGEWVETQR